MQTPLSTPGKTGPGASSNVKLPQAGGSVRNNWVAINQLASGLAGQASAVAGLRSQLAALQLTTRRLVDFHPFKLYTLPDVLRSVEDPTNDWRKFIVRAGRVMDLDATGTDADADGMSDWDPDGEYIPATVPEILVPVGLTTFWFWLEIGEEAVVVRYGPTPTATSYTPNPATDPTPSWTTPTESAWTSAPLPDANHIPIGWVDTATFGAGHEALVRQLLRADVVQVGGGGNNPCSYG